MDGLLLERPFHLGRNSRGQRPGQTEAENAVRTLIRWIGDDPEREGLVDTPGRVLRAYGEWFAGYAEDPVEHLARTFEDVGGYDDPITLPGIPFRSCCEHHLIATEVVSAAKAGDNQQLTAAQEKWSANGKDIAAFFAAANPNWSKAELEAMLQNHLDLTTGEVVGRLTSDWAADIKSYDEGHARMLMFADMLSDGLVKQFSTKFS